MARTIPSSPERSAYLNLLRAHELLLGDFAALFKERGLTHTRFNVLRIVIQGPKHGVTCSEISEALVTRVPDVTRLLDRMEAEGLVSRSRCPEDRRVVYVRLTPKGRRACESLYGPVTELHAAQFAHMNKRAVRELDALLKQVLERP